MKKSKNNRWCDYKMMTNKDRLDLLKLDKPNMILNVSNLKCKIDVDEDVYDEEDRKTIEYLSNKLLRNIYIDKTYVAYKGSRWGDSFIAEDKWYELLKLILQTNFATKASKRESKEIFECILLISMTYLMYILMHLGYDLDGIHIALLYNHKITVKYIRDNRTSWNF